MKKKISSIVFLSIIFLAAFLRFYKAGESDFMNADEYLYFTGAKIGIALRQIVSNIGTIVSTGGVGSAISELVRVLPQYSRPGYHLLSAIATFIGGSSKTTAFCLSAFLGILTVAAVYMLTFELFRSHRLALIASALLAVHGGHVLYSRMAQQTPGAILFLVLAFYFYVKARQDRARPTLSLMASAACLGLAFAIHPSAAYVMPVFILLELQKCFLENSNRTARKRMLSMAKNLIGFLGVFICAVLIWEAPHFFTHIYFIARGKIGLFSDYFTGLIPINNISSYIYEIISRSWYDQSGFRLEAGSFGYLPSFLIDSQGIPYFIVLMIAVSYFVIVMSRRTHDYRFMLLIAWMSSVYILFSGINIYRGFWRGFRELRVYSLIFPALCIMLALFFEWLFQKKWTIKIPAAFLFLFIFFSSIVHSWDIITSQFSYKTINEYLKNNLWIDKVAMNVNTFGLAPYDMVIDGLDGFVVADSSYEVNGKAHNANGKAYIDIKGSRLAVLYRNREEFSKDRVFVEGTRYGAGWPQDLKRLYQARRVRYLLTSLIDKPWLGKYVPTGVEPIFSCKSPFVCKARIYDIGVAPEVDKFYNTPYFQKVGIYDLKDIFKEE